MSAPHRTGIWRDPETGKLYDALTLAPITIAGRNLGEKPREIAGPPVTDDDLEEFARQLANRAKPEPKPQPECLNCDGSGLKARGWSGQPARDGRTCPDCGGSGRDTTPYGTGSDHCPHCARDWREAFTEDWRKGHDEDCPAVGY